MTIHEFTRYVPIGSKVQLFFNKEDYVGSEISHSMTGIVRQYSYSLDPNEHTVLLDDVGSNQGTEFVHTKKVAYVNILALPTDYDEQRSTAFDYLFRNINQYLFQNIERDDEFDEKRSNGIRDLRLSVQRDFAPVLLPMAERLDELGLGSAASVIRHHANNGSGIPMSMEQWEAVFRGLEEARLRSEEERLPDAMLLRRCEAVLYLFHGKYAPAVNEYLRHSAGLTLTNLVEGGASLLSPEDFASVEPNPEQALDWFLLAGVYHAGNVQNSCTYCALVQSILHRGSFLGNKTNQRIFSYLCGSEHDFTFLMHLLARYHIDEQGDLRRDIYVEQDLVNLGRLVCWMLYQMGSQGALDAFELIQIVEAKTRTPDQLRLLHELMLSYSCKYAARNRYDRFLRVTATMEEVLNWHKRYRIVPESREQFGYVYEFNGEPGAYMEEMSGFIMGMDLMPYRFSFATHSGDAVADELQRLSRESREEYCIPLVATRFEVYDTLIPNRMGAMNLKLGGVIKK